jgi:hypothetical protein
MILECFTAIYIAICAPISCPCSHERQKYGWLYTAMKTLREWHMHGHIRKYKVVQIWPGQTVTCLHTISPGHILTTLY